MKKKTHLLHYKAQSKDPTQVLRWLRRNMGERGVGWDFMITRSTITIEIWDERLEVMYTMFLD